MKISEIVKIKKNNFNFNSKELVVNKAIYKLSSKENNIFQKFLETKKQSEFLFTNNRNNALTPRRVEQITKKIAQQFESKLTSPSLLRKLYLIQTLNKDDTQANIRKKTGLTSLNKRRTLSQKELKSLHKTLSSQSIRNQLLIELLLETGIRIHELISIKNQNIQKNTILIEAQDAYDKKERIVSISKHLSEKISKHANKNAFLFGKEKHISHRRFEQICKEIGQLSKIEELTGSLLRATAIETLLQNKSTEEIKNQAGFKTNLFYTHGLVDDLVETALAPTQEITTDQSSDRKDDSSSYSSSTIYWRTRTRRGGGDADE